MCPGAPDTGILQGVARLRAVGNCRQRWRQRQVQAELGWSRAQRPRQAGRALCSKGSGTSFEPESNQRPKDVHRCPVYSPPLYQLSYRRVQAAVRGALLLLNRGQGIAWQGARPALGQWQVHRDVSCGTGRHRSRPGFRREPAPPGCCCC